MVNKKVEKNKIRIISYGSLFFYGFITMLFNLNEYYAYMFILKVCLGYLPFILFLYADYKVGS